MSQLYFLHSTPLYSPYSTQQLCPLFLRGITPGHQKGRSILNFNNVDIMRQSGGGGSPSVYSVGSRRRTGEEGIEPGREVNLSNAPFKELKQATPAPSSILCPATTGAHTISAAIQPGFGKHQV